MRTLEHEFFDCECRCCGWVLRDEHGVRIVTQFKFAHPPIAWDLQDDDLLLRWIYRGQPIVPTTVGPNRVCIARLSLKTS